ncbi:hypothetical protein SO802_027240 [Lithocarpus litseifolius]|uniref:Uncharacterized protein n=1 Tax=Lithocarpus litseifolius TaxID=425828 RepID=A0AAW2C1U8_9ROSI
MKIVCYMGANSCCCCCKLHPLLPPHPSKLPNRFHSKTMEEKGRKKMRDKKRTDKGKTIIGSVAKTIENEDFVFWDSRDENASGMVWSYFGVFWLPGMAMWS